MDLGLNFDAPFHSMDIAVPPECDFGRCPRCAGQAVTQALWSALRFEKLHGRQLDVPF